MISVLMTALAWAAIGQSAAPDALGMSRRIAVVDISGVNMNEGDRALLIETFRNELKQRTSVRVMNGEDVRDLLFQPNRLKVLVDKKKAADIMNRV